MNLDGIIKKIIGNNIFIFGGGKTGAALLKFLVKFCQNLNIFIFDDSLSREYFLSLINSKLNNNNLFVNLNDENDLLSKIKNESDLKKLFLIVSPGIDLKKSDSFIASFNRKYSLYTACDIELFLSILNEYKSYHTDICDIYTIGITGTNGKSTVSALTNYILNQNCTKSFIGGNFGIPIFELDKIFENIDEFKSIKKLFFVIELSSYQIDLINMSTFNLGAIINITSDHLERYDFDRNKYSLSKQKLINFSEKIIFGINDEECYKIFIERYLIEKEKDFDIDLKTKNIFFDKFFCAYYGPFDFDNNFLMNYKFNDINNKEELFELDFDEKINKVSSIIEEQGFSFNISNNKIIFNSKNLGIEFIQNTNLKGNHNLQNIIISYAISYIALKDIIEDAHSKIINRINTFDGLEHRMQLIAKYKNIYFINDSKATNALSCVSSLKCFENIFLILGGISKSDGLEPILPYLNNVKKVYLIGKSQDEFADFFKKNNFSDKFYKKCNIIENAVKSAFDDALKEYNILNSKYIEGEFDVDTTSMSNINILFSPACASFDQFRNFEERGERFIEIAHDILKKNL